MTSIFKKEVTYTANVDDFNTLVRKTITPLVNSNAKNIFRMFEAITEFEWYIDTLYSTTVYTGDAYDEYVKLCESKVTTDGGFDFHELMTFMAYKDIISPGKYIILT